MTVVLIVVITLVALGVVAIWLHRHRNRRDRPPTATSSKTGNAMRFSFLSTGAGVPIDKAASPPRASATKTDHRSFTIEQTTTNPEAYCLLSGTKVRECTCAKHRSVR